MARRLKALCPKCNVKWYEDTPKPEHKEDCPYPHDNFPVVVFRPWELNSYMDRAIDDSPNRVTEP